MIETFVNDDGNAVSIDTRLASELIHDYLFGSQSRALSRRQAEDVYLACDGFGYAAPGTPERLALSIYMMGGWDWSHVRDSSPQGFARALGVLTTALRTQEQR